MAFRPQTIKIKPVELHRHIMSVDVEDYFQVQSLAGIVHRTQWDNRQERVSATMSKVLDLFARTGTKATFFTLGWIAERNKSIVRIFSSSVFKYFIQYSIAMNLR